ncbi:MAG: hypothetical protein CM1200mP22_13040 [Dehalococcoidia bacterium]|nr:MAG: hypothetical protein CM1200mP22_13040 [Dehalococcoidia bacterium]
MESIIVALRPGVRSSFAAFTAFRVLGATPGMNDAGHRRCYRDGAGTFLRREYTVLAPFVIVVAVVYGH